MDNWLEEYSKQMDELMVVKHSLTISELATLCRQFRRDSTDGLVSSDSEYIKSWLKKNIKENQ